MIMKLLNYAMYGFMMYKENDRFERKGVNVK
jgi:hypothetical protein